MENASKALMMAGTILISIIIISAFIFMYDELSIGERQYERNDIANEIAVFNKSYESYAKELTGAQIMALARKMDDYNKTKGLTEDGYDEMKLIVGSNVNAIDTYVSKYKNYEEELKKLDCSEEQVDIVYKAFEAWSNTNQEAQEYKKKKTLKSDEIEIIKLYEKACTTIYQITGINPEKETSKANQLKSKIDAFYQNAYSGYQELKEKKFRYEKSDYSKNGRIKEMKFTQ